MKQPELLNTHSRVPETIWGTWAVWIKHRESSRQKAFFIEPENNTGFKVDKPSNLLSAKKKKNYIGKQWFSPPHRSWSEIYSRFWGQIIGISVSLMSGWRLGKHQNVNVMCGGWGGRGGTGEENSIVLEKVSLEETERIPVVQAGIWLYLFHFLINWILFPPQHLFALPVLKIACVILSINVIIFFLCWRCMDLILQSLWRLCSLSPLLNILCYISCTSIDLWSS